MTEIIETQRCLLAPATEADRDEVFALYKNEAVRKYLGGPVDRPTFDTSFNHTLGSKSSTNWTIRLKEGNAFVGTISVGKHHDGGDQEISYQILPEFWGQGLAFETLTTILDFAATTQNLPTIIAETQAANVASRKLLEKLGMSLGQEVIRFGKNQVIYRTQFKKHN